MIKGTGSNTQARSIGVNAIGRSELSNCADCTDERTDTERNDVQVTCLPVLLMFYPYPTNVEYMVSS